MQKKLIKTITLEEYNQLLDYVIKEKMPHYKDYIIAMILGFEAGMRISEIVGYNSKIPPLTKEQINFSEHSVRILGKGGKERIVPLPKSFRKHYLLMLPLGVGRRGVQHFIKKASLKSIGREISFHTLRHGFGSHLAGMRRPLHEIQMLMGHSRLDTTGIYLHANPKEAIEKARELF